MSLRVEGQADDQRVPPPEHPPDGSVPGDQGVGRAGQLAVRRLSDVPAETVSWLWASRIPYGKLTVLAGDPDVGKSYLTLALATAVTRGEALPGGEPPDGPGDVLMASYEDDAADTLRPRADLLGADPGRVTIIDGARERDGRIRPFCSTDVHALEAVLDTLAAPRLLIIDPVAAWVGGGVDTYRDNEVRASLEGLRRLAVERRIAVLCVMHLRKSAAASALARLSGSGAYGQLVRSALLAGRDPDDETRCALAHVKHNLAAKQPTIGYRVDDTGLTWLGEVDDLDGERLAGHDPDDETGRRAEAEAFLLDALDSGEVLRDELKAQADAAGVSWSAVERAKKKLAEHRRDGFGRGASYWWRLTPDGHAPHHAPHAPQARVHAEHAEHGVEHDKAGSPDSGDPAERIRAQAADLERIYREQTEDASAA